MMECEKDGKKIVPNCHFMHIFFLSYFLPFIIVRTRHNASFVSYAYARFTTKRELILCKICFSMRTIDSPFLFLIRFFSSFLHAYILPVALTYSKYREETRQKHNQNQVLLNLTKSIISPDKRKLHQNRLYQELYTSEMFCTSQAELRAISIEDILKS